jgi:hypothetical protein
VAVLAAPEGFAAALGEVPDGVEVRMLSSAADLATAETCDVIVWFGTTRAGLQEIVRDGRAALTRAGGLWIGWAKRSSGIATEVDADVVREVALPTGLVDNKICAIDEHWSGIRLVLRRELRGPVAR